jgi:hypothetical protein
MREFVLVDLQTQMPFLPREMREWPRERLLGWLRFYGEVREVKQPWGYDEQQTYVFQSWVGLHTAFVLTNSGEMFIPGTRIEAWRGEPVIQPSGNPKRLQSER